MHSIRNKREGGRGERRGDSTYSLLTAWVSDSEPVPLFFLTSAKPFSRHSQTLEAQSERGASVNEGKSRVKGSEEIPNVNEESIRFLRGL